MNNEYVYTVMKIEYDNEAEGLKEVVGAVYYDSSEAYDYIDEQQEFEEEGVYWRVDRHRVVFKENAQTFSGAERLGLEKAARIAERADGYGSPVWADGAGIAADIRSRVPIK
jgi:hypothetical protein